MRADTLLDDGSACDTFVTRRGYVTTNLNPCQQLFIDMFRLYLCYNIEFFPRKNVKLIDFSSAKMLNQDAGSVILGQRMD